MTSGIPESLCTAQSLLGLQQVVPLNCLANTQLIFLTADVFTDRLHLMSGNRIANITRNMLRQK